LETPRSLGLNNLHFLQLPLTFPANQDTFSPLLGGWAPFVAGYSDFPGSITL
jgi:hypothetical protein